MLRLLPGTISIAISFLVLSAAFTGVGLAVRRAFGLRELTLDDVFTDFWMGFASVILFLLCWNFFFPIGGAALAIVLLAGMAGLIGARTAPSAPIQELRRRMPWWGLAAMVLAILWVANLSLGGLTNYDTGLYHMQAVKWASTYPVVPGIANLHGPLAFNNSSLLFDALLDSGPWSGLAWHIANGLLVVVLVVQALMSGFRFLTGAGTSRATDLFVFLLLASVVDLGMGDHASSFMTDLPLAAVRMAVTVLWFRSLVRESRDERVDAYDLVCMVTLAACAVAIKVNASIFAAAMLVTASALWMARRTSGVMLRRTVTWCVAIGLTYGAAFTARGVVLSGYPLFPMALLPAPVEWRAPEEHALAEYALIVHSSRASTDNDAYISGEIGGLGAWMPNWISRLKDDPFYVPIPFAIAAIVFPFALVAWRRAGPEVRRRTADAWWILVPTVVSLVAWFVMAPEPRYATSAFWTIVALLGAQAFAASGWAANETRVGGVFAVVFLIGVSPMVVNPIIDWRTTGSRGNPIKAVVVANVRIPPPGELFQPIASTPNLRPFVTRSGLALHHANVRCIDADLPCTPNPAPNLRLRVPGRMEKGFVVDGGWEMQTWPFTWRPTFLASWRKSRTRAPASQHE